MFQASSLRIPNFIEAESPKALRLLMLKTNSKHGHMFNYFDIQQTLKGKWIAWFYFEVSSILENSEVE